MGVGAYLLCWPQPVYLCVVEPQIQLVRSVQLLNVSNILQPHGLKPKVERANIVVGCTCVYGEWEAGSGWGRGLAKVEWWEVFTVFVVRLSTCLLKAFFIFYFFPEHSILFLSLIQ